MKRLSIYIILLFAITTTISVFSTEILMAQQENKANSGSFYSGIGFGIPVDHTSPFTMGMGLSGISNYNAISTNISNPAQWGLIGFTQGSVSASLNNFQATDFNSSSQNAIFGIEHFQFIFPVIKNRMGISASITPMVRGDYRQRNGSSFNPLPGQGSSVVYDFTSVGSGGISRFETGFGFSLIDQISLGYAFSANILSMNTTVSPSFSQSQFRAVNFERKKEGYGFGHRFGIYTYIRNLLNDDDQLSFGASVTLPMEIDADQQVTAFRLVNNQRTLVDYNINSPTRNGNVKLPLEFNTGLTYNLSRFVNFDAELLIQNWNDALYTFDPVQQGYFKDRVRTGFGVQYHPYRSEQIGGFLSRIKYSMGVTYDTGHLEINDQDVETVSLNAGIGLMSIRSASSVDLSIHYGIRGTESANLVKENIWGFKISLNLAEMMFVRQRFQ
ncbi:MAG: hypothetical protein WD513_07450 [Balneolaceae bacterium]